MTGRTGKLVLVAILGLALTGVVRAEAGLENEYKIKSAVIFKLLKFIDIPVPVVEAEEEEEGKEKKKDGPPPELVMGVCAGAVEAYEALLALHGKTVKGRKINVRRITLADLLGKKKLAHVDYDVLFFPRPSLSQKKPLVLEKVLERLETPNALTIGDASGFVDNGGMINLLNEKNRIGFEINLAEARRAKVLIGSSVLKLAKRVIQPPPKKKKDDEAAPEEKTEEEGP